MILKAKNSLAGVHVAGKQTFDAFLQQRFTKVRVTFDPRPDHVSNVTRQQPVVKVGVSRIDTTALLLYTGWHVDGHYA